MALVEERLLRDIKHNRDIKRFPSGDIEYIEGVKNVKDALIRRLLTTPGALIHRPDYGVGIKDYQNAINSLDNQRSLALRIKEQFERDTRIDSVEGLKFSVDDDNPGKTTIFVKVNIRGYGETELDFVPFGAGGVV